MHKRLVSVMMVVVLLTAGLAATGCPLPGRILDITGSTTVMPASKELAEAFMEKHPDVTIHVSGGGSSDGVRLVTERIADIGNSSRELKAEEKDAWPELITHHIAGDTIAVVVHPDNKVTNLTIEQIRDIYAREITCWAQAGGDPGAIAVISREEGSGTRAVFEEVVMGDKRILPGANFLMSNDAVRTAVQGTPLAIGYISSPYLIPEVKALDINGWAWTAADYPLPIRRLYKLTMGEPAGLVKEFLDFVLSPEGQKVVEQAGFLPVG
ncbi:MAG: phosphate ABC transporter substrate-binding protein [Dehalococcoidia bacterium]